MPLWPNGEGIGLLSQGLWVQVPPGVDFPFLLFLLIQVYAFTHVRMYVRMRL